MAAAETGSGFKRIGSHRWFLISIILLQVGGFGFLWMKISELSPPAGQATVRIDPATTLAALKLPEEELMRESIRTVLKEELQTYVRQLQLPQQKPPAKAPAGAAETAAWSRDRPPASPQVTQQSMAIVDRALATGVWTDADNNALLKLAPQLSEAQRIEILEKIFGAINRQQLKAAGSLPSL